MIKPLGNNVLIDIQKIDQSALVMIDEKEAQMELATVLDIGEDVQAVKKGDLIVFKNYNLDTILLDNKEYYLIPCDDIKGIVYEPHA